MKLYLGPHIFSCAVLLRMACPQTHWEPLVVGSAEYLRSRSTVYVASKLSLAEDLTNQNLWALSVWSASVLSNTV